jgi:hypothetical protein
VDGRGWHRFAMRVLFILSLAGLAISVWAHVESLLDIDPASQLRGFWLFQLLLFGLMMPIAVELFRKQPDGGILRSPHWMRITLYLLLFYYGIRFYVFLYWSTDHLSSAGTWRMFSSGWMLLFSVAAVYYEVRSTEARLPPTL